MIRYRRGILRIAESWFDEESDQPNVDILRCMQRSQPVPHGTSGRFYTVLINLDETAERLLSRMKRETRYEIRRAIEKDQVGHQMLQTVDDVHFKRFKSFYESFTAEKGAARLNTLRLRKFSEVGALVLSVASTAKEETLVWHAYYRDAQRARLLYSASLSTSDSAARSLVGRANRFLHWQDMVAFQGQGVRYYDFGGWYEGRQDLKKLGINHFKEGFGGELVVNYNCLCALTYLGRAATWLYGRLKSEGMS